MNTDKYLIEDNEEDGNYLRVKSTGIFYEQDSNGVYQPVKPWKQEQLENKYFFEVTRRKMADEENIDIEQSKLQDVERCETNLHDLGQEIISNGLSAMEYKKLKDQKEENDAEERYEAAMRRRSSNNNELRDVIGIEINDFLKNLCTITPKYNSKIDWRKPNPRATIDPRLPMFKQTKDKRNPIMQKKWDQLPLVLFFFDRSASFNPKDKPEKTNLGKKLIQMFKEWEYDPKTGKKQLEFAKPIYFATNLYDDNEQKALNDRGNSGMNLLAGIEERTKGRIVNVVVLTDHDSNYCADKKINICGSFWCVFAESKAPNFYNSVSVSDLPDGTPGAKHYYFFKKIT